MRVGKRCLVHSKFAVIFQVVVFLGGVISVRAGAPDSRSLFNSSWSNLLFALINPSLQFGVGSHILPQSRSQIVAWCGSVLLKDGHA